MFLRVLKVPPRGLESSIINYLCDSIEGRISEKIRIDIRSKMSLMKSHMIGEIISSLDGIPRHVGTKDSYEEAIEDLEAIGSSGRSN